MVKSRGSGKYYKVPVSSCAESQRLKMLLHLMSCSISNKYSGALLLPLLTIEMYIFQAKDDLAVFGIPK